MNFIAKSKLDGHILESLPYNSINKELVLQNLKKDLEIAGVSSIDYAIEEVSDNIIIDR